MTIIVYSDSGNSSRDPTTFLFALRQMGLQRFISSLSKASFPTYFYCVDLFNSGRKPLIWHNDHDQFACYESLFSVILFADLFRSLNFLFSPTFKSTTVNIYSSVMVP